MKLLKFFLPVALAFTVACNNSHQSMNTLFKDSVMQEYIHFVESSGMFDTSETDYKMLKAYADDNIDFFREEGHKLNNIKKWRARWIEDSCIHQLKLQEMNVDEAYRFIYSPSSTSGNYNITLTKLNDSINLHSIKYSTGHIINEVDKKLTLAEWQDFSKAMYKADFWGLKRDNGRYGLDGGTLDVLGYTRNFRYANRTKFNAVSRLIPTDTSIEPPFYLLLKLSGIADF